MAFADLVRNHELAYISRILSAFGVVEEQQIRTLFGHLDDKKYGQIISRMSREGLSYRTPDAKYVSSSRYTTDRTDTASSVLAFWGFICVKDRVKDFCPGTYPTIVTIATNKSDSDLIPLTQESLDRVNDAYDSIPDDTVRLLVLRDQFLLRQLIRRRKNDVAILVKDNGTTEIYDLGGRHE